MMRALSLFALAVLALSGVGADRPNILFIMSDDHCAQAVGAYGGRLAELNPTPTIDRLRARIGDEEQNFPEIKKIIDEFWEYDRAARQRAIRISHEYLTRQRR